MQRLDPLAVPLHGTHLIEASAGTGKTYTISSLVLRLLLGHADGRTGHGARPLESLLIVTFTRAATAELRARIRQRIDTAARVFADPAASTDDELIRALVAASSDRERDARVLQSAALDMDLAAICTIHGFAQRVLSRNAFESRVLLAAEIATNDAELREEALVDAWREHVYPLSPLAAALLASAGCDFKGFIASGRFLLQKPTVELLNVPPAGWGEMLTALAAQSQLFLATWQQDGARVLETLAGFTFNSGPGAQLAAALAALDAADDGAGLPLSALAGLSLRALRAGLNKRKKQAALPDIAVCALADAILDTGPALAARLLADTVPLVRSRLRTLKDRSGLFGYDDLLLQLDEGLSGPGGERLAQVIRQQFPVAFIDEFQDTDALQYRVFARIHGHGDSALFMVGDPKQAIYAFRGADVHAYLQARRAVASPLYLDTNHRSVRPLVAAVNELFMLRADQDPFLGRDDLPFAPVAAAGGADSESLRRDGAEEPVLQVLHLGGDGERPLAGGAFQHGMAALAAGHLHALLVAAQRGELSLGERRLVPGDVACLVRGWPEAKALCAELRARAIPYVYTSRDSVYQSDEAQDVHQLLAALLDPADARTVRAALAVPLLGRSAQELDRLIGDDTALLRVQQRFFTHAATLLRYGPQPALRALLFEHDAPARLLAAVDGERRLTDCMHLLELLQAAHATLDDPSALLAQLAASIARPDKDSDEQRLRLESDADRVQIVTLHASKGLEYPVVYLPFVAAFRAATDPLYYDPASLRPYYDLLRSTEALALADRERLAEDMRLLYVGMTRARQCLVLGVADVRQGRGSESQFGRSALGYLLDGEAVNAAAIPRLLQLPSARLAAPPAALPPLAPSARQDLRLQAREFHGHIEIDWTSTSYSALARQGDDASAALFRQPELRRSDAAAPARAERDIFAFPAGAGAGTFLHRLFETVDFALPAAAAPTQALLRRELALAGHDAAWLPVLTELIDAVLDTPLDAAGLRLRTLAPAQRVAEMEFTLPLAAIDAARLNTLLHAHDALARGTRPLEFNALHGMLTGFIDLVCEHEGRYYIIDFKSNHMGRQLEDYAPERLADAIRQHHYHLQYALYTLALVRLLRARLGAAFDYTTHVGGVYYLFLRGMRPEHGARCGVWAARPSAALIAALDTLFSGGSGHGA